MSLPENDRSFVSKTQMEENIITLLGGRVSEKIILDDISTGASNDIERATRIARSMVTRYGFSEKLGPVVYGHDDAEVFLGRDYSQGRNYSENIAAEIDAEIRELIETGYEKAKDILESHKDQLHMLAKYLLKYEKIDGDDFDKLMKKPVIWSESDVVLPDLEAADQTTAEGNLPDAEPKPEINIQPEVTAEAPPESETPGGIIE